jgi:hypothetical protein
MKFDGQTEYCIVTTVDLLICKATRFIIEGANKTLLFTSILPNDSDDAHSRVSSSQAIT